MSLINLNKVWSLRIIVFRQPVKNAKYTRGHGEFIAMCTRAFNMKIFFLKKRSVVLRPPSALLTGIFSFHKCYSSLNESIYALSFRDNSCYPVFITLRVIVCPRTMTIIHYVVKPISWQFKKKKNGLNFNILFSFIHLALWFAFFPHLHAMLTKVNFVEFERVYTNNFFLIF